MADVSSVNQPSSDTNATLLKSLSTQDPQMEAKWAAAVSGGQTTEADEIAENMASKGDISSSQRDELDALGTKASAVMGQMQSGNVSKSEGIQNIRDLLNAKSSDQVSNKTLLAKAENAPNGNGKAVEADLKQAYTSPDSSTRGEAADKLNNDLQAEVSNGNLTDAEANQVLKVAGQLSSASPDQQSGIMSENNKESDLAENVQTQLS